MAHVVNGRDGQPKTLGVKIYEGQTIRSGSIILKQRGLSFKPGINVGVAKDHTLYALIDGLVKFDPRRIVSVIPKPFDRLRVGVERSRSTKKSKA